ncbi:MAG: class I SAM-dependent methyltransferase [Sulfurifustaceae bacterium]
MAEFKDHFSAQSASYAKYRPGYPDALFDWLATLTDAHDVAWDVGTGSGQAALGLARHFAKVIATDPAEAQLRSAVAHPHILYRVLPAEQTDFSDASVDLITVAQALHWFDFDRFYAEVRRVLKPAGTIAVWTYGLIEISPAIDILVRRLHDDVVGRYWPPERQHVIDRYRKIPFPFPEVQAPAFALSADWTLDDLIGYFGTWSGLQRYVKALGRDPVDAIRAALTQAWGKSSARRTVTWPLHLRVGRLPR